MKCYTTQLARLRKLKLNEQGYKIIDISVKSGDKDFAPLWSFLMDYKNNKINEEEYTEQFLKLMNDRLKYSDILEKALDMIKSTQPIVLVCYCRKDAFCHRNLIVQILTDLARNYNLDFEYCGFL